MTSSLAEPHPVRGHVAVNSCVEQMPQLFKRCPLALQPTAFDALMAMTGGQSKHTRGCVALRQLARQGAGARLVLRPISLESFTSTIAGTAAATTAATAAATATTATAAAAATAKTDQHGVDMLGLASMNAEIKDSSQATSDTACGASSEAT